MADGVVGYDSSLGIVCTQGVCDLRHDVGVVNATVKDAESNIRHDVGDAECNIRREVAKSESDIRTDVQSVRFDVAKSECSIKDAMSMHNLALMNRLCEIEKQALKAEYEAKLTAQMVIKEVNANTQHTQERLADKVLHAQEEVSEKVDAFEDKFEDCCCDLKERFSHLREEQLEEEIDELRAEVQTLNFTTKAIK